MKASVMLWILFAGCIVLAILRFALPMPGLRPDDIFKDVAHLFVAGLFGAAIMSHVLAGPHTRKLYGMAFGLTLVEIVAAGMSLLK